jgi:phenylalanyl-tRNA synthetase beta chain
MTGAVDGGASLYAKDDAAFYAMKGAVEAVLRLFVTESVAIDTKMLPKWLHSHRSARVVVDGKMIGWFGQLHPGVAEARKLRQPVWVGELDVARLLEHELRTAAAREVSRFQAVERDFSFTMDDKVEWAQVAKALDGAGVKAMTAYAPAEIFRGKNAGGKYSLLLRVTLQAADHTLSEEELQSASERVIATVRGLGGELRK